MVGEEVNIIRNANPHQLIHYYLGIGKSIRIAQIVTQPYPQWRPV